MRVLLTGSTGFVGGELYRYLLSSEHEVICAGRSIPERCPSANFFDVGSIDSATDWSLSLSDVDVVVHLAAFAHNETLYSWEDYWRVNVEGTLNLARQLSLIPGKRFIFLSSIGVNGDQSASIFTSEDVPSPKSFYAKSKLMAEQALRDLASVSGLDVVIIRPPLVYGRAAPGNFRKLASFPSWLPLPLGSIANKRSFISIDNLVDLITCCLDHPAAKNQVFLASDGEDLSTTDFLIRIGKARGAPYQLIPMPTLFLRFGAYVFKRQALAKSLIESLQIDISKTCQSLGWTPPLSVDEGLKRSFIRKGDKL